MKIVVAPDSFKGCLSALKVARNIKKGIKKVYPRAAVKIVPMADGGEGTVENLVAFTKGKLFRMKVTDPLGYPVKAFFGILGDGKTAVIEMAAASGFPLVPESKRDPMATTTYGTGELIRGALDKGCKKIIIGIGGSATCDGGAGTVQALGARLLNADGEEIGFGGGALADLREIDVSQMDERISATEFLVACDVDNPLVGLNGAAFVYAPQKGATKAQVSALDINLENFAEIVKCDLGKDIKDLAGAGAAGGLGGGLVAFLQAVIRPGVEIISEILDLENVLQDADLVITGEGKIDSQTVFGKTPVGVAKIAKKYGLPVIAVCGSLGGDWQYVLRHGLDAVFSVCDSPMSLDDSVKNAPELLAQTTENIFRTIRISRFAREP